MGDIFTREPAQYFCSRNSTQQQPQKQQRGSLNYAAEPYVTVAQRSAVSSPVSAVQARRKHRKRGCRGHGALERRRQNRPHRIAAVVQESGQRAGTRRSGSAEQDAIRGLEFRVRTGAVRLTDISETVRSQTAEIQWLRQQMDRQQQQLDQQQQQLSQWQHGDAQQTGVRGGETPREHRKVRCDKGVSRGPYGPRHGYAYAVQEEAAAWGQLEQSLQEQAQQQQQVIQQQQAAMENVVQICQQQDRQFQQLLHFVKQREFDRLIGKEKEGKRVYFMSDLTLTDIERKMQEMFKKEYGL